MRYYLNQDGSKIQFDVPAGWNVLSAQDSAEAPTVGDVSREIERALDNPIGCVPLEQLAGPGMKVTVLFDDMQRPTPVALALPAVLDRLNRAGVQDGSITAICALGTHPAPTPEQLEQKVGKENLRRLAGRVLIHDPQSSENVFIGRTSRGSVVEVNRHVAEADLVLGIGSCMPHPYAGFSGGCKILIPGAASYRTIADHHYSWLRNRTCKLSVLEGNLWYEDTVAIARLARLSFKLDLLLNEANQVIQAFAGDPVEEHRAAAERASSLYQVFLPKTADVVITSAAPLEPGVQATKSLLNARLAVKTGGTIIWAATEKQPGPLMHLIEQMAEAKSANEYHRRLLRGDIPDALKPFGISFFMLGVPFKELAEQYRVIHATQGLTRKQVELMHFEYAATVEEAIGLAAASMPRADVTILPSGGTIIPVVRSTDA